MNLPAKLTVKFFNIYFWRQHPETALRYAPVVREINKSGLLDSRILEIGSGSLGIVPFLKKPIDGVDTDFSGPKTNLLRRIKAKAYDLPFRKNSYDVVISVDLIEHIEPALRPRAIYDIVKVAKKLAVIVVPEGEDAENQDKNLRKIYSEVYNETNQFLEEHVKFGLPKKEQLLITLDKSLRKLNKKAKIRSYPVLNLKVRYFLMRTYLSKGKFAYYLYLKGYLLLLPFLKLCNFGKCYRRTFVIEFAHE